MLYFFAVVMLLAVASCQDHKRFRFKLDSSNENVVSTKEEEKLNFLGIIVEMIQSFVLFDLILR